MKRIAVFSDTHNMFSRLPLALERVGKVDMLFHLGDFAIHSEFGHQSRYPNGDSLPVWVVTSGF